MHIVKRFYNLHKTIADPAWRRRFRDRLREHRHSLWHMARHLPDFITARRHFEPAKTSE